MMRKHWNWGLRTLHVHFQPTQLVAGFNSGAGARPHPGTAGPGAMSFAVAEAAHNVSSVLVPHQSSEDLMQQAGCQRCQPLPPLGIPKQVVEEVDFITVYFFCKLL